MFVDLILTVYFTFSPDRKLGPICHQIGGRVRFSFFSSSGQWFSKWLSYELVMNYISYPNSSFRGYSCACSVHYFNDYISSSHNCNKAMF